ncbi:MAG: hypothetical protein LUG86_03470, partial [Oscillospiraceae bacterium]|nr:hypothetical protein [Oscillospiraceae bacterium]
RKKADARSAFSFGADDGNLNPQFAFGELNKLRLCRNLHDLSHLSPIPKKKSRRKVGFFLWSR